ncbi:hypothetical protein [Paenibacillus tengchongensis]|uniref:hypothetical protein n=1 Tax=Paenibacillus tengchongensis TaxID=2608684 RepID=UPI00124E0BED|nr:hypothetical protein [Paenibacillus tengchongensis]
MKERLDVVKAKKMSIYTGGMWVSLIIGLLYTGIGILMPLDPAEKYRGTEFYEQIAAHPFIPHFWRYIFVVIGFLSLYWINAAVTVVRTKSYKWEGLYRWVTILGYGGAAMLCIEWMREIFIMKVMTLYSSGNEMYRTALEVAAFPVDPDFLWMFGGFGLWYLVTSLLAKDSGIFSRKLNILGIIVGLDLVLTMVFAMTDTIIYFDGGQMTVMQITALLGGIAGAVYHIWMFFDMKKNKAAFEGSIPTLLEPERLEKYSA